jgi:hypothetical protein
MENFSKINTIIFGLCLVVAACFFVYGNNVLADSSEHAFTANGSASFNYVDSSGNAETVPANISNVDTTAPTGAITAPADSAYLKSGDKISAQADDNGSGIGGVLFYYYNSAANQIGNEVISGTGDVYSTNWYTGSLADGRYTLFAAIYDKAGNLTVTNSIGANLDNTPPAISSAQAINPQTVQIIFTEPLQNLNNLANDFTVYENNGTNPITISSASYANNIITLNLSTALQSSDNPTFKINSSASALTDLAGNQINDFSSGPITEKIAPTLILIGAPQIIINVGTVYSDPGASCTDFANNNPTIAVIGAVNSNVAGIYDLRFNCTDPSGNQAAQLIRTVIVKGFVGQNSSGSVSGGNSGNQTNNLSNNNNYFYACRDIVYGQWGSCFNGIRYRNVLSTDPLYCTFTSDQQAARSQVCGGQVLGAQLYSVGSLVRTPDKKIFLVLGNNQIQKIKDLKELAKYKGRKIYNISSEVLAQLKQVLGVKIYADGTLLRTPDKKIYVIINGQKNYISSLKQLAKYKNSKIYNVTAEVLANY